MILKQKLKPRMKKKKKEKKKKRKERRSNQSSYGIGLDRKMFGSCDMMYNVTSSDADA